MYFIQYLQNIYNDYTPKLQLHYLLLSIKYLHNIYADLPTSRPHIYGLRSVYPMGALLNLSCESGPSSPPPVSTVLYCIVLYCTVLYGTGPPLVPERRRAAARPRDGHGARLPAGGQEGRGEVSAQTPAHGGNTSQVFSEHCSRFREILLTPSSHSLSLCLGYRSR